MTAGDFETPEQRIPATGIPGKDWETCMTINGTWGFRSYDTNWKSPETLIRNLVDIASKGGNYLLNVGPTAEGLIPEPSVERLKAMGQWMKRNGEGIYATTASPFQRLPWGRCTKKVTADGATLYLHVFDWPKDGQLLVPGLKSTVERAYLLADAKRTPMAATSSAGGVTITVPTATPDPIATTVVLKITGKLDVEQPVATADEPVSAQDPDGSIKLLASKALLHGAKIKYEGGSGRNNIGFWTDPNDWAEWKFTLAQPGKFAIAADCASRGDGTFAIVLGDQKLTATVIKTGDYTKFQRTEVGTVVIPAGTARLIIRPIREGWKPVNLRSVVLKPAP
jgi:alpha-L-fucosidase